MTKQLMLSHEGLVIVLRVPGAMAIGADLSQEMRGNPQVLEFRISPTGD